MGESALLEQLGKLRRRGRSIGAMAGVLWFAFAALVALAIAAWLDLILELPPPARVAAMIAAALVGAAGFLTVLRATAAGSKRPALARRLDELGATGGQIVAGVYLAMTRLESFVSPQPALSAGLAQVAVGRAASLARTIPAAQAVPLAPLVRASAALGGALLLGAALVLLMPALARTQWLRFSDPYGDHPPYSAILLKVEPGAASVRYGDALDIFVTAEGRLVNGVELVLQPKSAAAADTRGEVLPMFQEPSGRWRAALAEVKEERQYFARARRSRSEKYPIRIITIPRIEDVRFRLTPPAYSRSPVYEGGLPENGLAGLAGTKIEISVRSNRPLASACAKVVAAAAGEEWIWTTGQNSPEIRGALSLERTCRLEISVTDIAGQSPRETFSAPLTLLHDDRPFVRLLEPRAVSFATPSTHLPVIVSAEDDYGVATLAVFRSLNESPYSPLEIPLPEVPPRQAYQVIHLPLDQYGLAPGDEIRLFARASDNDPAGAKGAESSVVTVRIISEEEFEQMLRTRDGLEVLLSKYQQAERRLEALAEQIDKLQKELAELPPDSPLAEETHKALENLAEQMQQDAAALAKLAAEPLPYELDKELSQHLAELAEKLGELGKQSQALAGLPSLSNGQAKEELEKLRRQLQGDREELQQQTGPPLEMLAAVYPLLEDEARFTQLYERQRDLEERLKALRGRDQQDDPALKARIRDLEEEQQRLHAELLQLLDDIDSHAKQLPDTDDFQELKQSAEIFASLVRNSEAPEAMSAAARALAEFSGTQAHAEAKRAADILETFLAKCQGMGEEGAACLKKGFQPGLGQSLGETLSQLLSDAGLKRGSGPGGGAGGGYSARRSSLDNIGLYGGLPQRTGPQRAGLGNRSRNAAGEGRYASGPHSAAEGGAGDPLANAAAAGGGEAAIPSQYRRKVGRYFQRLADELGDSR